MINTFILFGVALLSFVGGAAAAWLLRRQPPAAAAAPIAPVPGTPPASAGAPLEMHLVLNVLNRVVMALGANEQAQEGVAELADYLRAADDMRRRPGPASMVRQSTAYWRLSRWLHGQPADLLRIEPEAALQGLPAAALAEACRELTDLIRELEPARRVDLVARLALEGRGPASLRLVIQVSATGVDEAIQRRLGASPGRWTLDTGQLSRRLELPTTG